ncbi:unnamed protein product [Nippostrongylus brasiliensis]|uniref:Carbamoyl-phosphate synthase (glutamine-hydrolyzing) n=1 Tax=Nippostrongylus brasiliensis TaxID=27835 RepID=A0A0N4XTZ9_NIPBR|nr:unnamed protein product [Nippostrongylus brasiliensis]
MQLLPQPTIVNVCQDAVNDSTQPRSPFDSCRDHQHDGEKAVPTFAAIKEVDIPPTESDEVPSIKGYSHGAECGQGDADWVGSTFHGERASDITVGVLQYLVREEFKRFRQIPEFFKENDKVQQITR